MAKFDGVIQKGLKASALLDTHTVQVTPRLPAGHGEYLKERLTRLGAAVPTQKAVRQQAKQSGGEQLQAMTQLRLLLSAIRDAVKNDSDATTQDKKEYGVGQRLDPKSTNGLLAAAQSVLKVAREKPARAQLLSILPDDVTKLDALHVAAVAADKKEDQQRAAAPLSTKQRNEFSRNVSDAVKKIAGAGILAFALDEAIRADFEALLVGPKKVSGGQ